jgi:hypothetical protein
MLAAFALWSELRPEPTIGHPFAIIDIEAGQSIDGSNTEIREIGSDLLDPIELGARATTFIRSGEPVLASDLDDSKTAVPTGWYRIEVALPHDAEAGDRARLVSLDTGAIVDGVVVSPSDTDPLGSNVGTVAVEPALAGELAVAAAQDRVVVMILTG